MNDDRLEKRLATVRKIIQEEKRSALENFRKKDFRALLDKRIEARAKPKYPFTWWFRKPVPIIVSLVLIFVIGLFLKNILVSSLHEESLEVFEEVLAQFPYAKRGYQTEQSQFSDLSPGAEAFFHFEQSLKHVLLSLHQKKIPDDEIPVLFQKDLIKATKNWSDKLIIYEERELSLYEIEQEIIKLREGKNCRQFFLQIIKKLQEV